jgi:cell division protein FtsL
MGGGGSRHMNPINQVSNEMNKEQFENINKNNNIFYISIFIISIIIFISIIYLYKNRYKG